MGGIGSAIGSVVGGAAGFLVGGPAGAAVGAGIGGGIGGGSDAARAQNKANDALTSSTAAGVNAEMAMFNRSMNETQWLRDLGKPFIGDYTRAVQDMSIPYSGPSNIQPYNGLSINMGQNSNGMFVPQPGTGETMQPYGSGTFPQSVGSSIMSKFPTNLFQIGLNSDGVPIPQVNPNLGHNSLYDDGQGGRLNYYQMMQKYQHPSPSVDPYGQKVQNLPTTDPFTTLALANLMGVNPDVSVTPGQIESDPMFQYQLDKQTGMLDSYMSKIGALKSSGAVGKRGQLYQGLLADSYSRKLQENQQNFSNMLNSAGVGFNAASQYGDTAYNRGLQQITIPREWNLQNKNELYSRLLDALKLSAGAGNSAGNWAMNAGQNMAGLYAGMGSTQSRLLNNDPMANSINGLAGMAANYGLKKYFGG